MGRSQARRPVAGIRLDMATCDNPLLMRHLPGFKRMIGDDSWGGAYHFGQ